MEREGPHLLEMQGALCFVLSRVMENAHADMRSILAHHPSLKNAFQNAPAEKEERKKEKGRMGW